MSELSAAFHYSGALLYPCLSCAFGDYYQRDQKLGESSFLCIRCLENCGSLSWLSFLLVSFVNLTELPSLKFHRKWDNAFCRWVWGSLFLSKYAVIHR